jgi:hypothetical protein
MGPNYLKSHLPINLHVPFIYNKLNLIQMKNNLCFYVILFTMLCFPSVNFAQTPTLGAAANFVLFSTNGAVSNTGISQLTGNVGTNNGSSTAFGNVNGVMHDQDTASIRCATDLLTAYKQLNDAIPAFFPAPLLGNGQMLTPGIYSISGNATLNLDLTLNAQGDENAAFIFQVQGAFSSSAAAQVILTNGAKACHVFWKVEGLVSLAAGTQMKGTIIANNAAIELNTKVILEGRALSTTGAVTVNGILGYTPIGCGSATLTGPVAPVLASTVCYALFSSNGAVTNTGISKIKGDIGTNVGLTTGYNSTDVNGTIHPIADVSTATCAADLLTVYNYLNTLPYDIELLYPVQFGNKLVLTPHTYRLNGGTTFNDTLYLNAQGNPNAVFVMQLNGALSSGAHATVKLINGTKPENVFWKVEGSVTLNDYSDFKGTIVCNNGAIDLTTGVALSGRALATKGILSTAAISAIMPEGCKASGIDVLHAPSNKETAVFYPNPSTTSMIILLNDASTTNSSELKLYTVTGKLIISKIITTETTTLETGFPAGIYFYQLIGKNKTIQSGKLISQ